MIEDEIKPDKQKFVKFLLLLFVLFLVMYISKETGFYEFKAYNKSRLTTEEIKRFEKDISEGKNVTLNDYKVSEYKDYSNFITKGGSNLNKMVETIMNKGIKKTLKVLNHLFYEHQG